ncbi:MAG: NAD(P)H-dependent oxidoreductase [Treponemataceae bacterium]|nr:NAD(P)H-dependent oxidoreductase [Treponemataceae bacterium]
MNILVVYCHPSSSSFTFSAKQAFVKGVQEAGNECTVSDLYAQNFNPVISESEYLREAFYSEKLEIPADVKAEQDKIEKADAIVFIFPNFWTSAPAMLEGWFQRVWTYGYAYGSRTMKTLEKAVFIMTMGGSKTEKIRQEQIEAIKCCMIGDRIHDRAKKCEFYVFDEMTRGYGNDENRLLRTRTFCQQAYQIGKNIAK